MFLVAAVIVAVASVPLAGGRLSRLASVELRAKPVIYGALVLQVMIVSIVPGGDPVLHRVLHLVSYALAAVFLFANRRTPGFGLVTVGAALNLLAIAANGGVMPASRSALRAAGELRPDAAFINSTVLAHPRLLFLGDVFAIPSGVPLHNVFSVGDVCIALGAAVAVHALAGSRVFRGRVMTPPAERTLS